MPRPVSQSQVRDKLFYCEKTGLFFWRGQQSNNIKPGDIAGFIDVNGYRRIRFNHTEYKAHRLVWLYIHGYWPPAELDHINGIRHDNRLKNLRLASRRINSTNRRKRSDNTSGFNGVIWNSRDHVWKAQVTYHGRRIHLGSFADKEDAIAARKEANIRYSYHPNHGTERRRYK